MTGWNFENGKIQRLIHRINSNYSVCNSIIVPSRGQNDIKVQWHDTLWQVWKELMGKVRLEGTSQSLWSVLQQTAGAAVVSEQFA